MSFLRCCGLRLQSQAMPRSVALPSAAPSPSRVIIAATSRSSGNRRWFCSSRFSSPASSHLGAVTAAAAAALVAAASASFDHERSNASCEAATAPELEMLGKSLRANHERQMVKMAKLLHGFAVLAEEAERGGEIEGASARTTAQHDQLPFALQQGVAGQYGGGTVSIGEVVHVSDAELSALAQHPDRVWGHISMLRNGAMYGREDVKRILRAARNVLIKEPSLIDLSARTASKNGEGSAPELKTVTVVGDLHGHFENSLIKVLDMVGADGNDTSRGSPWEGTGAVIFNGDFVDRGKNSLEVILALLLLKLAYPNNVYLNRGNHEDSVIATVYGYSDELQARYGNMNEGSASNDEHAGVQDLWKEFEDVFASLPLAVNTDTAVIMHGGLPSANFSLEEIAAITPEERFRVKTMIDPEPDDGVCILLQNITWSDPRPEEGVSSNEERGCGVRFGPDVVHKFLAEHGLKYLIRSHEPVDAGYELLECDEHGMSVVTVFSAANYPDGDGFNYGAIVQLHSSVVGGDHATYHAYGESGDGARSLATKENMKHVLNELAHVVAANRAALDEEFAHLACKRARRIELQKRFSYPTLRRETSAESIPKTPAVATSTSPDHAAVLITPEQWADAMNYVLQSELPNVDWLGVRQFVAPGELIDYKRFLNVHCSLSGYSQMKSAGMSEETLDAIMSREELDALFAKILHNRNHEAIFRVFKFLDTSGDGRVDREEFCRGIDELKRRNPDSSFTLDAEALFDSIDADKSGTIELAEFQHAFQACGVPYHVAVMMSLDQDKSGTIDRLEFQDGIKLLNARLPDGEKIPESDEEVNKLFDELDRNGDGELDLDEFERFVRDYFAN